MNTDLIDNKEQAEVVLSLLNDAVKFRGLEQAENALYFAMKIRLNLKNGVYNGSTED